VLADVVAEPVGQRAGANRRIGRQGCRRRGRRRMRGARRRRLSRRGLRERRKRQREDGGTTDQNRHVGGNRRVITREFCSKPVAPTSAATPGSCSQRSRIVPNRTTGRSGPT